MRPIVQFRLTTLLGLTLACAIPMAGWHYLGKPGGMLGAAGCILLWFGCHSLREIWRSEKAATRLDIGTGIVLTALGIICLGLLVHLWADFYRQFGWGWWQLAEPEVVGE